MTPGSTCLLYGRCWTKRKRNASSSLDSLEASGSQK
jgi:hypothetical protein